MIRVAVAAAIVGAVLWVATPASAFPSFPNPLGPIITGTAGAATSAVLDGVSTWVASGTATLLGSLADVVNRETAPNVEAAWFTDQYRTMLAIAALLALPLLFAAAISAVLHQDLRLLLRALFVHLPLAGIGTGAAAGLVTLALGATDGLCSAVTSATGSDVRALFTNLASTVDHGIPGAGGFAAIIVAVVVALGALALTIELILRDAAVYVAMLFLPIALSGMIWPATMRWGKRLAEMLAALILSKFVIVAIISLAIAALSATSGGLSAVLTGAALLILAAIAPFTLLRMAPIVEAGAMSHLEGAGQQVGAIPRRATAAAQSAAAGVLTAVAGGAAGGSALPTLGADAAIGPDATQTPRSGATPQLIGAANQPEVGDEQ